MTKYEKLRLAFIGAFLVGVLLISKNYSDNGRYFYVDSENIVLDTRTGEMFYSGSRSKLSIRDFEQKEEKEQESGPLIRY